MEKINIKDLLELLDVSLTYERELKNLNTYLSKATSVLGVLYKVCNGCSNLMKRYHNEIQKNIWAAIRDYYPEYLPPMPAFKTPRYCTEHWAKTLPIASLFDLKANAELCDREALKFRRLKNNIDEQRYFDDRKELNNYRILKSTYTTDYLPTLLAKWELEAQTIVEPIEVVEIVEAKPKGKIDKDMLLSFKTEGKSNVFCADYFGVSKSAITQALKELNYVKEIISK